MENHGFHMRLFQANLFRDENEVWSFIFDIAVPNRNSHVPPIARREMSLDQETDDALYSMFDRKDVVSNSGQARAIYDALTRRWRNGEYRVCIFLSLDQDWDPL